MQSKRRDLHHTWSHRETKEKLSFYYYSPRWITTTFSTKIFKNCSKFPGVNKSDRYLVFGLQIVINLKFSKQVDNLISHSALKSKLYVWQLAVDKPLEKGEIKMMMFFESVEMHHWP